MKLAPRRRLANAVKYRLVDGISLHEFLGQDEVRLRLYQGCDRFEHRVAYFGNLAPNGIRQGRHAIRVDEAENGIIDPVIVDHFGANPAGKGACDCEFAGAGETHEVDHEIAH